MPNRLTNKTPNIMSATIQIVPTSAIPKYKQIVNSIIKGIERQSIGLNERLPSINEVSIEFDVSRDTVEKAYKQLKKEGVIFSVPGKGYFTAQTNLKKERRILLVFNKLSAYKKMIFEGFVNTIGQAGQIDFQVYHENYEWFEKIITEKAGSVYRLCHPPFLQRRGRATRQESAQRITEKGADLAAEHQYERADRFLRRRFSKLR
jgi:DNA-binding transcriptional regulator YhcF (GntR family)